MDWRYTRGGQLTNLDGTRTNISVNLGTGSGTFTLMLNDDDSIVDTAGNPLSGAGTGVAGGGGAGNGSFEGNGAVDRTGPSVVSINRVSPASTNGDFVTWRVVFSEAPHGLDVTDFALDVSGITGTPAVLNVNSTGAVDFDVTASTGNGSGTLGLNLNDDDSITDGAGTSWATLAPVWSVEVAWVTAASRASRIRWIER